MCVGAVYMVLGSFLSENEEIVGNDTATAGLDKAITSIDIIPEMLPFIVSIFMVIIIVGLVFLIPKSGGGA